MDGSVTRRARFAGRRRPVRCVGGTVAGSRSARTASGSSASSAAARSRIASSDGGSQTRRPARSTGSSSGFPSQRLIDQADHVAGGRPEHLVAAGQGGLAGGALHDRAAGALDQLVDAAQGGVVAAGDQAGAGAEAVERRAGCDQLGDAVLVEVAGADDLGGRQAGGIEHGAHLARERVEVAGVEAHGGGGDAGQLRRRGGDAGAGDGLVGVDQERRPGRLVTQEGAERVQLGGEAHHVGVGHGAGGGDAPLHAGGHGGGGDGAADVGAAGGEHAGLAAVGAAEAEVEDGAAGGGLHDTGGLGGDQGLEVDLVEEVGLDQLADEARALDAE